MNLVEFLRAQSFLWPRPTEMRLPWKDYQVVFRELYASLKPGEPFWIDEGSFVLNQGDIHPPPSMLIRGMVVRPIFEDDAST